MASLARITIVGNLGRDAELKYTSGAKAVLEFTVAASEKWNDAAGQPQEVTTWFRVSLWGKQAETLKQYLTKGKQVLVEGRLRAREYQDREGHNKTSLDVRCDNVLLLGGRESSSAHDDIDF